MKNNYMLLILFTALILCLIDESYANSILALETNQQNCISCHSSTVQSWQKSDHAKSMALPNKNTVLANFNNIDVEHYGQKARFFIKEEQYWVTISYDKSVDSYPIKYTFGYFPLQQYLVETEPGRLQVLPFAWDARDKEKGGQRWYHNYSHEDIKPEDRLHWRQPLQNWNGMCADCHSDGLTRNYDSDKNQFNTQFDNINVGCLSCHNDMSKHVSQRSQGKSRHIADGITLTQHPIGQWLRKIGDKTAHWQGAERDNSFMDNCFSCHSLRSPLTDGIKPNTPFLEQFMPQIPSSPNYFADGQIKEEVYVYGSFLQSKMYGKGVNCLDCHDKHTMKVKIEGNGLCLQCHGGEVYNVKTHHQHEEFSTGAQCVNCHMPSKQYMGADDRRDHSFKIPRPELSKKFGTPNACIQCHQEESNQWATENLKKWYGKPKALSSSKMLLILLNSGQEIKLEEHLRIIADNELDVISRATAIQQLAYTTRTITAEILKPYLRHKEDLLRLSATSAALLLPPSKRVSLLVPLLSDKLKSIRIGAARSLVDSKIPVVNQPAFIKAFSELQQVNTLASWRGEGRINQGGIAIERGNFSVAEESFKAAIAIEPYLDTGYINLSDLYRSLQRPNKVKSVLIEGMQNLPLSSSIKYSYGLHLVRQKNITQAIGFFKEAMLLSPSNAQFAYTYILALEGAQGPQVLHKLKALVNNYSDKTQLRNLGLYLSKKLKEKAYYEYFLNLPLE